jgi:ABC-type glycerol-3-phosphate transport system substrate-binding protein
MMQRILIVLVLAAGLAACGEKPQTAATKKSDSKPWEAAQNEFVTGSWKAGDQASWEAQMKTRAQGQNEYSRAPAQK